MQSVSLKYINCIAKYDEQTSKDLNGKNSFIVFPAFVVPIVQNSFVAFHFDFGQ